VSTSATTSMGAAQQRLITATQRQRSLRQLITGMSPLIIIVRTVLIITSCSLEVMQGSSNGGASSGMRMKNIPKSRSFGNPQGVVGGAAPP
jgi:hypothetical protein